MKKLKSFSFYFFTKSLKEKSFLILFILTAFVVSGFFVSFACAVTEINEDIIMIDTNWTKAESPYLINSSLFVAEGVTLYIESGTVIKFDGDRVGIFVRGKIDAEGTVDDPIYFTSNYDDVGGSTDDDYENCNYDSYDEDGNGIGEETCVMEDWSEPYAGDWDGLSFESSKGSILNNVFVSYAGDAIYVNSSDINFENLNINESISGLTAYSDSNIEILGGVVNNLDGDAFYIFDNSSLHISDFNISNVDNGFTGFVSSIYKDAHPKLESFENEKIEIVNTNIACSNDGLIIFNDATLSITGGEISCGNDGLALYGDVKANISGVKISGAADAGIVAYWNTEPPVVTNSEITGNNYGLIVFNSAFSANQNSIHDNLTAGAITYDPLAPIIFNFENNWWGDKSGPTHSSNPDGIGDVVSDNILFNPFLKVDPLLVKTGISSVMLIPGFEASRMYKMKSYLDGEVEDKLWEPNAGADVRDMYMNDNGVSIDNDIYTRDIVDTASLFGIGVKKFYRTFMNKMDELVESGELANWKAIAYDWRLSPTDIVDRGIENEDGNISYNEELVDGQVPYIIGQLQELVDSSNSGKATIVVHSNGGLVAKALVFKLEEMKKNGESDLVDYIDKIIFVGSPLLGTPEAVPALMHGYDQGKILNLLLSRKNARSFGQNVPSAYNLLPSEEYINDIDNDLITFDESLDKLNNWRTLYGDAVDNYAELKRFLSGVDSGRTQPSYDDLRNPLLLNESLFDKAKIFHDNLDNLVFPETMKIYKVAGWGIPTTYDLRYKTKNECASFLGLFCISKKLNLSSDLGLVSGGDGTVIAKTALAGDGTDYYLNLGEYNKIHPNKTHADMFDVSFLFDLVDNILKGDSSLPEYISMTPPSPIDFTVIKMHSPVAIDIYNEEGLHTGMVENEDPNSEYIQENIPNSSYLEVGDEKYIIVPSDSDYRLELSGQSDGIFTLEQDLVMSDSIADSVSFKDISTTSSLHGEVNIEAGSLATSMSLDRNGDNMFESTIYGNTTEKIARDNSENHSSSGSIPFLTNVIPGKVKNEISTLAIGIEDNNIEGPNLKKFFSDGSKKIKVVSGEVNPVGQSVSASVGDSGIIKFRTILFTIIIMAILLIGVRLLFRIKI